MKNSIVQALTGSPHLLMCSWLFLLSHQAFGMTADSTAKGKNVRFVLSLDSRSTIIDQRHVRINGLLSGISFGQKRHKITAGYYWLGYDASKRLIDWHKKLAHSINLSYYTKTDVAFISFAYWYPVIRTNKWAFSVPVELGIGQETARYRELSNDNGLNIKHFRFVPFQAGLYGEYRLTPWAGLDAQVGYRNAISENHFRKHFAGIYYSYGISLYPGTIYQDLKEWQRKRH